MSHFTTLRAKRANLTVKRKIFLRQQKYLYFYSKYAISIYPTILAIFVSRRNIILGKVKKGTFLVIFKHTVKSGDACLTSNGRNNPRGIKEYFALYFMTGGIYVLKLVLGKTLVIYYYLMKR